MEIERKPDEVQSLLNQIESIKQENSKTQTLVSYYQNMDKELQYGVDRKKHIDADIKYRLKQEKQFVPFLQKQLYGAKNLSILKKKYKSRFIGENFKYQQKIDLKDIFNFYEQEDKIEKQEERKIQYVVERENSGKKIEKQQKITGETKSEFIYKFCRAQNKPIKSKHFNEQFKKPMQFVFQGKFNFYQLPGKVCLNILQFLNYKEVIYLKNTSIYNKLTVQDQLKYIQSIGLSQLSTLKFSYNQMQHSIGVQELKEELIEIEKAYELDHPYEMELVQEFFEVQKQLKSRDLKVGILTRLEENILLIFIKLFDIKQYEDIVTTSDEYINFKQVLDKDTFSSQGLKLIWQRQHKLVLMLQLSISRYIEILNTPIQHFLQINSKASDESFQVLREDFKKIYMDQYLSGEYVVQHKPFRALLNRMMSLLRFIFTTSENMDVQQTKKVFEKYQEIEETEENQLFLKHYINRIK